jgi:hypothetical protein
MIFTFYVTSVTREVNWSTQRRCQAALHTLIDIRSTSSMVQTFPSSSLYFMTKTSGSEAGVGVGVEVGLYFMFMTLQQFRLQHWQKFSCEYSVSMKSFWTINQVKWSRTADVSWNIPVPIFRGPDFGEWWTPKSEWHGWWSEKILSTFGAVKTPDLDLYERIHLKSCWILML